MTLGHAIPGSALILQARWGDSAGRSVRISRVHLQCKAARAATATRASLETRRQAVAMAQGWRR